MTVITDANNVVVEICLIPGVGALPEGWHVYFPARGTLPAIGAIYNPDSEA